MRREQQTVRDALRRSGEWMDGYGYALLAEEWRTRAAQNSNTERPAPWRGGPVVPDTSTALW
jgi:hypothetical protein